MKIKLQVERIYWCNYILSRLAMHARWFAVFYWCNYNVLFPAALHYASYRCLESWLVFAWNVVRGLFSTIWRDVVDAFLERFISTQRCVEGFNRATARVVVAPNFPKKTQKDFSGTAGEGVYIRQQSFAKMTFFKVDLKCFPMEQSLSRMNYIFFWAVKIRC